MASYSQDFIDKLRDSANIVDIIGQYTELKSSGHQYLGRCPFPDHPEKTPSFSVSESKQLYHCFGCKKSGNIFTFLATYSGMSFPESVEYLARRYNIPLPAASPQEAHAAATRKNARDIALRINALAMEHFHKTLKRLPSAHPANQYRLSRGLSDSVVQEFRLGYASESWDDLTLTLEKAKLPVELAEKLGLIKARTSGKTGHYDFFRDRLIFPILSPSGDVIGFGGRALGDAIPKYLNSAESPLFSKGKSFYLLDQAARYIRSDETVIVVEGYMDAIAMHRAGFKNTIAVLGTALTAEHAKILKRHTQKVILLFDTDRAGNQAARASLPILLNEGLFVHGFSMPEGKDPDEYLKTAPTAAQAMKSALQGASELFYIVLNQRLKEYRGSAADKVAVLDDLADILTAVKDTRLKALYVAELAERLQVTPQWVARGVVPQSKAPTPRKPLAPAVKAQFAPPKASSKPIQVEKGTRKVELLLVNLALKNPECLVEILLRDIPRQLSSPALREILRRADEHYRQKPKEFDKLTALLAEIVDPINAITRHLEPEIARASNDEDKKLLHDCIQNIQEFNLKKQAQALAMNLKQPLTGKELEQFMNVVNARRALKKEQENQ